MSARLFRPERVRVRYWAGVTVPTTGGAQATSDLGDGGRPDVWQRARCRRRLSAAVIGSALAALLATVAIVTSGMLYASHGGHDGWLLCKAPAALLLGEAALRAGFESASVLAGIAVWLSAASLVGTLFGACVHRLMPEFVPFVGFGLGAALWSLALRIGRRLPELWAERLQSLMPESLSFLMYVLFGLAIGLGAMAALFRTLPPEER